MRRRDFITLTGGAAMAWPFAAHGRQPTLPVVGYFSTSSADTVPWFVDAFREGLAVSDFIEGKTVSIEYRWAERHLERLPALALDLVQRRVNVIFAVGEAVLRAAWAATRTTPIVAVDLNADPIEGGMAASFAHPGGNVTGIFLAFKEFAAKWLDLLKEIIPQLSRVAILSDPSTGQQQRRSVEGAAEQLKVALEVLEVRSPSDLDEAFNLASQRGVDAVLMLASPLFLVTAKKAADLAISHRLPAFYFASDFARAGGLMTYGPNLPDTFRQAGVMTSKVLHGTKPADLPIELPTKFEMVINLKTAKALRLEIPSRLVITADEVIE
jgi:putative tryptophan/tyrosine transport system substrate-binding protein